MTSVLPGAEEWTAEGDGDAAATGLLAIHGFTGSPASMTPMARRANEAGHPVSVPRLPGHGTTVAEMAGTRYADWVGRALEAHDALADRCERVVVAGLSMGGAIAIDIASQRPVAGLVTVNAAVLDREGVLVRLTGLLRPLLDRTGLAVPRQLAELPPNDIARPDAREVAYDKVPVAAGMSLTDQMPRLRAALPRITCPAVVAWSPQDHSVPPENSATILELLGSQDVTTLVMERSYHVATLDWDAELLEDAVLDLLQRVG